MKKYLMILGGFTGILFLFTVIPARFSAQPDHAAEYSAATPVTTLSAEESAAAPESERTRRRCAGRTGCWTSPAAGWKRSPSGTM